jgi:holin-like protein
MKQKFQFLLAFISLVVCWLVGNALSPYFQLPPSLLGLLFMLAALLLLKRVPLALHQVSGWALRSMALLFIPVTVGAVSYVADLGNWLWLLLLALLISSAISLIITAWLAQKLLGLTVQSSSNE